jgi:hypothetical protein
VDLNDAGAGTGTVGRTEAFGHGSSGNPYRVANSLQQDSAIWNDEVGSGFTPQSVLNTTVSSGDGMSADDYSNRTLSNGTLLPTGNGESTDTRQGIAKLLLDGKRQVGTL